MKDYQRCVRQCPNVPFVADVAAFSAGVVEEGSERLEQSTMQLLEKRAVISNILDYLSIAARIAKLLEESYAGEP